MPEISNHSLVQWKKTLRDFSQTRDNLKKVDKHTLNKFDEDLIKNVTFINSKISNELQNEYITNLQQQINLLEMENNYIKEKALKVFNLQPQITEEMRKTELIIKDLEERNNELSIEVSRKNAHIEILNDKIAFISNSLKDTSDLRNKEKDICNQDIIGLKMDRDRLSRELANKDSQIEELRLDLNRKIANVNSIENQNNSLKAQFEEKLSQNIDLTKQIDDKKSELMRINSNLREMEFDFKNSLSKLDESSKQKYMQEIKQLENEVRTTNDQFQDLLIERDQLTDEASKLQDELSQLKKDHNIMQYELDQIKSSHEKLEYMHGRDSAQIEKLSSKEKELLKSNHVVRKLLDEERDKNAKLLKKINIKNRPINIYRGDSKQGKRNIIQNTNDKEIDTMSINEKGKENNLIDEHRDVVFDDKLRSIRNALSDLRRISENHTTRKSLDMRRTNLEKRPLTASGLNVRNDPEENKEETIKPSENRRVPVELAKIAVEILGD